MEPFETREYLTLTHEGQKIFGILHRPLTEGPAPCVMVAHGFAGNKIGHRRLYVMLAEALARQGIATLRFDHRGCGDSEGGFSQVTMDTLVSDALHALSILSDLSTVDPEKIGILGVSLGGPVSVRTAHQHGNLSSIALWAPLADGPQWETDFGLRYPSENVENHIRSGGESASAEFRDQFLEICMKEELKHLSDVPVLHIHGECDEVVFTNHAEIYEQARGDAEAESCFHRFPASNHNFSLHAGERQELVKRTVEWFKKTLS